MALGVTSKRLNTLPTSSDELADLADRLLSLEMTADLLGASVWTIRKWITKGKITSNKIGARRLVPLSEVRRVIAESTVPRLAQCRGGRD